MKNDWVRIASGAALGAAAVVAIYQGKAYVARSEPGVARETMKARPHPERRGNDAQGGSEAMAAASASSPVVSDSERAHTQTQLATQLDQVKGQLEKVVSEKDALEREKRELEARLVSSRDELQRRDQYRYDIDRDEWKKLAAEGRVRYRMPCLMPLDSPWKVSQPELVKLGLSPEDGEILAAAQRRSNVRVWGTLRPLCMKIVGNADVVDLLGGNSCLSLIEKVAGKSGLDTVEEARRQVAEVHAGLRPAPDPGKPQNPVFESLLAVSSEGERFEADLAQSFGPEEAKRVWRSLSCAATRD